MRIYTSDEARHVWRLRESGPRAAAFAPGAPPEWEGWDDSAVAPEKLGAYLRDLRKLLDEYGYRTAFYGHFGHGCIHMRINFDLQSENGIRKYAEFVDRAADLVVSYGGSLSGEHGDGQSRGALLPKMFGPELMKAFGEFKRAWDPDNRMNPHKVVDAYLPTENLRLGRGLQAARSQDPFPISRRRWFLCEGRAALHRTRRMPQARQRLDVPQLHGDARGAAQHARAARTCCLSCCRAK